MHWNGLLPLKFFRSSALLVAGNKKEEFNRTQCALDMVYSYIITKYPANNSWEKCLTWIKKKSLTGKQTQKHICILFCKIDEVQVLYSFEELQPLLYRTCLLEADAKISRGRILCCWGHMRLPEVLWLNSWIQVHLWVKPLALSLRVQATVSPGCAW